MIRSMHRPDLVKASEEELNLLLQDLRDKWRLILREPGKHQAKVQARKRAERVIAELERRKANRLKEAS